LKGGGKKRCEFVKWNLPKDHREKEKRGRKRHCKRVIGRQEKKGNTEKTCG